VDLLGQSRRAFEPALRPLVGEIEVEPAEAGIRMRFAIVDQRGAVRGSRAASDQPGLHHDRLEVGGGRFVPAGRDADP
jgi:hypothetical protein